MPTEPRVIVDVNERKSTVPDRLAELGAELEFRALPGGDYLVGRTSAVERKSMPDLHDAILRGRFWRQLGKLRSAGRFAYLIVEGSDIDDGPLRGNEIRGVLLAALEQRIRLLRTKNREDTALWLYRLALRCQRSGLSRDRPQYAQRHALPTDDPAEAMLAAVPGISTIRARALLSHFGSVADVVAAGPAAWQNVHGIGPDRARALAQTLSKRPTRP
jgi:ERCC4-type nuclease